MIQKMSLDLIRCFEGKERSREISSQFSLNTEENGFVTATKLGTTNKFFVAATKYFAAATKRFVDRTKHFVVLTIFLVIPIFTNDFVGITKRFFP